MHKAIPSTPRSVTVLSSKEAVDFPELGLAHVSAKVDTGADSSAIWASDVHEIAAGGLAFTLFAQESKYYTGTVITTSIFKRVHVRSSSGNVQYRYKVKLLVCVKGRRIRAWFSLADRSAMQYPILLGRRLLKDKFIVDVGLANSSKSVKHTYRVLVLVGAKLPAEAFYEQVAAKIPRAVTMAVWSLERLAFWVETGNCKIYDMVSGIDIADFDAVYFKSHRRYYEFAITAAAYLDHHHVPFIDEGLRTHVAYDKLTELMSLALHGMPVPPTFCGLSSVLLRAGDTIDTKIRFPFVCKEINADRSRKNYLLQNIAEMAEVCDNAPPGDIYAVQQYIPNDGYIRALVFGEEVALVMHRSQVMQHNDEPKKMHLNAPRGSANATLLTGIDIPPVVSRLALQAARIMRRQVAGVDLIRDSRTGEWLVLEVNGSPQIHSGAFTSEKENAFAKFIDFWLDK